MYEVFSRLRLGETEELRNIGSIPKLLPLLASALEFGLAAASALIALLKMGSWLSVEEFNIKVHPTIVKLFASNNQVDEEPVITTNTTIFLGNIGSYLNEGTRKRVLINAFTVRALRDTFPPARGAGIMALCTTSSYYDITKVATRILPNVVVLTIDPDRTKTFQVVDQFFQIPKQHYEKTYAADTSCGVGSSFVPGNATLLR
ncbi:hypothetical protein JHK82_031775 [Glycine max]|nr:hypothetical protein JHK85_032432 [Glycine max]KAG4995038.1 hypothetical protein JHK86_031865 [Glycine max]KAG5125038.1 hypothetical protein JHK82_031775 [Glycine max]KAG5146463.1 hypothetical protein JHK84_032006 [Glycine max]